METINCSGSLVFLILKIKNIFVFPMEYSTCRKHFQVPSPFMSYHRVITRLTRRLQQIEQELCTLPSSPLVFSGVRASRSLVVCICFVYRFCSFSFGHCVVCPSIYGFWIPLWYLQTLLLILLCFFIFV
jgi:hypothetical protein